MSEQDKQLLLVELCARLPYEVAIIPDGQTTPYRVIDIDFNKEVVVVKPKDRELIAVGCLGFEDFKLILRPMSSMTEEEKHEIQVYTELFKEGVEFFDEGATFIVDLYNKNHLDYRGLIEKGLAIEVTPENNPYKYKYKYK